MASDELHIRVKVWVADRQGEVVIGTGRMRLLEAIDKHGSILQAAEELGMSYRSAWGRLKTTEARLGKPILEKVPGAGRRGGSRLTPLAKELLLKYRRLIALIEKSANETFGKLFLMEE